MSATGRSDVRRADDFYQTPGWCTRALLKVLALEEGHTVLDPCAGEGAILDAVGKPWVGFEIDPVRAEKSRAWCRDALGPDPWGDFDVVITNPPYSLALEFVQRALAEGQGKTLAFLLRLNFAGSQRRAAFHRANPSDIYVLPRRPSFTNGGTDSTEYAWFVFGSGRGGRWQVLDMPLAGVTPP